MVIIPCLFFIFISWSQGYSTTFLFLEGSDLKYCQGAGLFHCLRLTHAAQGGFNDGLFIFFLSFVY